MTVVVSGKTGEGVNVAVGKFSEMVGGIGVGVACAGRVSASAREMPPMTSKTDMMAMITPPPSCRKDCINSPSIFGRGAEVH